MKKGDNLDIKNLTSIINDESLNGLYQFDSYENLDGKDTCYITKKIGNGFHYLVVSKDIENYLIPDDKLINYGIKKKQTKPTI